MSSSLQLTGLAMEATVEAAIEVALGNLGAAQLKLHVTYEVCHLLVLESASYQTVTTSIKC